jgi:hypothetical protein
MDDNFDNIYGAAAVGKYLGIDEHSAHRLLLVGIVPSGRMGLTYVVPKKTIERALATPLGELLRAAGRLG